jgi:hypothetical protein
LRKREQTFVERQTKRESGHCKEYIIIRRDLSRYRRDADNPNLKDFVRANHVEIFIPFYKVKTIKAGTRASGIWNSRVNLFSA